MTPYDVAQRFVGVKEFGGPLANPVILTMLQLDAGTAVQDDATPWCSAFSNFIAWMCRLPRSKSLAARSWLTVGRPVNLLEAKAGYDVVVLKRGDGDQPGPDVLNAPGHVGFFVGLDNGHVLVLGGNQGDAVTIERFARTRVLGVRRLSPA